jgi:UPF0755 protein
MTRSRSRFFLGFILLGIAGIALYLGATLAIFATSPAARDKSDPIIVEVKRGEAPSELTRELHRSGAITDTQMFSWLGRITRSWKKLKAGEYEINAAMTPLEILSALTSGVSMSHPLTVKEGQNMYEVGSALEQLGLLTKTQFVDLCKDSKLMRTLGFQDPLPLSLEGYLYPETYFLNRTMTPTEIIRVMVKRSLSFWDETKITHAKSLGLSRHEAVILASIIEKETGAESERPLISSVFHNRLRKKMRLQSDPTTIYGIWETYGGNLTRDSLKTPTPFNTYTTPALPAGPISNPGREAMEAAINPAQSDFLFFVSRNDGTHEFTSNLAAHNDAVNRLQRDPKAREGKSWRDLSKRTGASTGAASAGHP